MDIMKTGDKIMNTKKELMQKIPAEYNNFKEFVSKLGEGRPYEVVDRDNLVIDEVDVGGRQYMIEIDLQSNVVGFIDDLVSLQSALDLSDNIDVKEWNSRYEKLKSNISNNGFELQYTGNGGNEDYEWYKVMIKIQDFNYDKLVKVSELWTEYNNECRKEIL